MSILVGIVQLFSAICFCIPSHVLQHPLDCQNFCTLQLSSIFYLSQEPLMVQGFIFEGDVQCSKLFKKTICKGVCTLKCTEKRFIPLPPLPPPFPPLICQCNKSWGRRGGRELLQLQGRGVQVRGQGTSVESSTLYQYLVAYATLFDLLFFTG